MSIASKSALITIVESLMGGSYSTVSSDGYSGAVDQALNELPFTFPITDSHEKYWIVERARRHVIYVLLTESAHKFKYKEISLQHRFANYFKLISKMDADFEKALNDFPELFDVLPTYSTLCEYITNGFVYDQFGRDFTY